LSPILSFMVRPLRRLCCRAFRRESVVVLRELRLHPADSGARRRVVEGTEESHPPGDVGWKIKRSTDVFSMSCWTCDELPRCCGVRMCQHVSGPREVASRALEYELREKTILCVRACSWRPEMLCCLGASAALASGIRTLFRHALLELGEPAPSRSGSGAKARGQGGFDPGAFPATT